MFNRFFSILALIILPFASFSQVNDGRLDSLRKYTSIITSETADFEKYAVNEKLQSLLEKIFMSDKSYDFPFDSLERFSAKTAPDKKFKLLTWGIAKEDGTFEYFGYIFFPENSAFTKRYIKLTDNTLKIAYPENDITDFSNWYGAIYYDIVPCHYQGKKQYTLLGWKGNNSITSKKVIEILYFRSNGTPVFGKRMFRKYNDKAVRVIFEYSSRSSMLLRHDKQMIHTVTRPSKTIKSKYNSKDKKTNKAIKADKKIKAKIKTTKADMIIFDRLSPMDPRTTKYAANLEGQFQFYVPESNIMDAFIFENGKWYFVKDVDARNPKPNKKVKVRQPQL